jgi:hypothetical protein
MVTGKFTHPYATVVVELNALPNILLVPGVVLK